MYLKFLRYSLYVMKHAKTVVFLTLTYFLSLSTVFSTDESDTDVIAFGSCLKQYKPAPIFDAIINVKPDVFIFSGDNIYADTSNEDVMLDKYAQLNSQRGFKKLKQLTTIYATWDDHDYGKNDAGAEFLFKQRSQEIFLDFFQVPIDAPSRKRDGIYSVHWHSNDSQRIQIILLDTRFFRGPLIKGETNKQCPKINYARQENPKVSMLGVEQWDWLKRQLLKPAQLRIIVSSIQVIPEEHCFEKWANLPHEREKLFQLIGNTKAEGVIFLSGDRHLAEISKLDHPAIPYPLYEVTSSGLNSARPGRGEKNQHRISQDNIREDNFGLIRVDWNQPRPVVDLQIRNVKGAIVSNKSIMLSN